MALRTNRLNCPTPWKSKSSRRCASTKSFKDNTKRFINNSNYIQQSQWKLIAPQSTNYSVLWQLKVNRRLHKSPSLFPTLSKTHDIPCRPISLSYILILSSHPRLGFPSGLLPSDCQHNILCTYSLPHTCHKPCPSSYSWLNHLDNVWLEVRITQLATMLSISHSIINKLYSLKCGCNSLCTKNTVPKWFSISFSVQNIYIYIYSSARSKPLLSHATHSSLILWPVLSVTLAHTGS